MRKPCWPPTRVESHRPPRVRGSSPSGTIPTMTNQTPEDDEIDEAPEPHTGTAGGALHLAQPDG